jgi:hypothetical protein
MPAASQPGDESSPAVGAVVSALVQLPRQTCCGHTWVGADRAHCCIRTGGCGHVFDVAELFDAHRDNDTCTDPRTLDLLQTKNGIWLRSFDLRH